MPITAGERPTAIVWFRNDLRLADNPALFYALRANYTIVPIFIYDDTEEHWPMGGATRWWLHYALQDFSEQIHATGGELTLRRGQALQLVKDIADEVNAQALYFNERFEPHGREIDRQLTEAMTEAGIIVERFNGHLLNDPESVLTQQGTPYKVFTPYWRSARRHSFEPPHSTKRGDYHWSVAESEGFEGWGLLPILPWADEMESYWEPTRKAGLKYYRDFLRGEIVQYDAQRNLPAITGTSFLSPYLHFGQVGVRELVALAAKLDAPEPLARESINTYIKELGWRDFANYLLYHFPHTTDEPLNPKFKQFPWTENPTSIDAWQKGLTGYPIIDAGMRQLWTHGWMHNRVRMIVSSFLVKHLLQPWQVGAHWFWDTLVDADLASNTMGWQWSGGCGADAAPYFRIFNPVSQGQKFDGNGEYVKQWLPELNDVPIKYVHTPWLMSEAQQAEFNCSIGEDYPKPIIDLKEGRERALAAWSTYRELG